jgi:hypothetical protein
MMLKGLKWVSAALSFVLICCIATVYSPRQAEASGTVYYVDSSGGNDSNSGISSASPWKTLAKVNSTTFSPGDKILFKAGGSWTGQLWPKGSGISGSPIVIDMYGTGAKPHINGGGNNFTQTVYNSTNTYNSGTVFLKNQQYWEIQNLDVSNDDDYSVNNNDSAASRAGVFFVIDANQSDQVYHHIYIRNLDVHDVDGYDNPSSKLNGGIVGLIVGTYDRSVRTYSRFDDIRIENNTISKVDRSGIRLADHSLYVNDYGFGNTSTMDYGNWDTNVYVGHNALSDIGGDGIVVRCTDHGVVEYNVLNRFGTRVTSAVAGIWTTVAQNNVFQYNEVYGGPASDQDGMAYDLDKYLTNTIFQYNYSHDNPQGFLLLMGANNNDVFRYNISQNDGHFIKWINAAESAPSFVYNNIYYYDGASSSITAQSSLPSSNNLYIYNNIFYNKNSSVATNWGASWASAAVFSHNGFYERSGVHASGEPADNGKIVADPQLASPGTGSIGLNTLSGYKLQSSSPLIGQALYLNNNGGMDFWGNALYQGHPDIGANEVTDPAATGTVFQPSADAYVRDGSYAGTNYGSDSVMFVKSDASGYNRKAYVKFNYSSLSGSSVSSAKLRVFINSVNTSPLRTIKVYGTDESWTETGITWNNAPAGATYLGSMDVENTSGIWKEFDVTGYVNSNMSDHQVSFLLVNEGTASSTNDVQFNTKEASASQPQLVVQSSTASTILPSADAYVRDGSYAGTNYGSDSVMYVKTDAAGYNRKSYVKFNYSSFSGSSAGSAKLRVYVNAVNTDPTRTIKVYGTNESWTETGITWNNAPVGATYLGSFDVSNTAGIWKEFDVTSYVNSNMSDHQVSFLLFNEGAVSSKSDVQFNTKEATADQPQLVIQP